MRKDVIAIVGAGKGGSAILETLVGMPDIVVQHVCDANPEAPGLKIAAAHGIHCCHSLEEICRDENVDLIFEATGHREVYEEILSAKPPGTRVIGHEDSKIIYHLLDIQRGVARKLSVSNTTLENLIMERTGQLELANQELTRKIVEAETLNAKLQEINNEKTRYLMHATHQLKAPFAAIQSYTDIMLAGYPESLPEKTAAIVAKIRERCQLLSSTILEMLELANLKSLVRENISIATESLNGIIQTAIDRHQDLARSRDIRIAREPPAIDLFTRCNRNQMVILLSVFIENAVSYSRKGGVVEVSLRPEDNGKARISVTDHGIGIEAAHTTRIFEEFFRTNSAVAFNERGSGLGLAIAKEIATIHGFSIQVSSVPERGSTFSFVVDLAAQ